ncbi:CBS domain-containing protein [Croceicoccus sp. YJ47]|uniref:CBS domain-containing protein n=1 Tax=Croceicoccus sp. YJ47 TaxID=2798724 RepID=UPI001924CE20|nr:CBS domain-containing protein [Croceicoccus sp. YJ47]QQN74905.1 CBS domain-containing protein [Croceicoccus sp. YJ47]
MHHEGIGSVGIVGSNPADIQGIVSQQELMAGLAQRGPHALQLPALIFMRRQVLFCSCDAEACDVMLSMTRQRFRHCVVRSSDLAIAGLVSLGDLVAALLEEARLEAGVLRNIARGRMLSLTS